MRWPVRESNPVFPFAGRMSLPAGPTGRSKESARGGNDPLASRSTDKRSATELARQGDGGTEAGLLQTAANGRGNASACTGLEPAAVAEREEFGPSHRRRAPTYLEVATRPLHPGLGISAWGRERRESESNALAGSSPAPVFETVAPANRRSLQRTSGWPRGVRTAVDLVVSEALCR